MIVENMARHVLLYNRLDSCKNECKKPNSCEKSYKIMKIV